MKRKYGYKTVNIQYSSDESKKRAADKIAELEKAGYYHVSTTPINGVFSQLKFRK